MSTIGGRGAFFSRGTIDRFVFDETPLGESAGRTAGDRFFKCLFSPRVESESRPTETGRPVPARESRESERILDTPLALLGEHPVCRVGAGTRAQNQPLAASSCARRRRDAGADGRIDLRVRFSTRPEFRATRPEVAKERARTKKERGGNDDDDDDGGRRRCAVARSLAVAYHLYDVTDREEKSTLSAILYVSPDENAFPRVG